MDMVEPSLGHPRDILQVLLLADAVNVVGLSALLAISSLFALSITLVEFS